MGVPFKRRDGGCAAVHRRGLRASHREAGGGSAGGGRDAAKLQEALRLPQGPAPHSQAQIRG